MLTLLHNEWRSRVRSAFSGKDVAITVILIFFALYMLLNVLALAYFLPELIRGDDDGGPVFMPINKLIFYYFLFDLFIRFFLQSFPLLSVQPLLVMPIDRRKVFHFILIRSLPNFFNLLPLILGLPVMFRVVIPEFGLIGGLSWLAFFLLIAVANHYLVFLLKRMFSVKPALIFALLLALGGVFYLDMSGRIGLSESFGNLIAQVVEQPILLLIPLGLVVLFYLVLFQRFRQYAYLDAFVSNRQERVSARQFTWLDRFGNLGELIRLDLKLIWRNKRPRTMMLIGLIFIIYPLLFIEALQASFVIAIFIGIFISGFLMIQYGQFMLSWESTFFDFMLTRNFSIREYFEAKYYFFAAFITIFTTLSLAYGFLDVNLPLAFIACALFNLGVNSFVLMFSATYNVKRIELTKGAFFNYEGVGANQFVMLLPLLLIPIFIYLPFGIWANKYVGLAVLAIIGIIGIVFRDRLLDQVVRQFEKRKYAMSAGFKAD
jgi:hypothetical protein